MRLAAIEARSSGEVLAVLLVIVTQDILNAPRAIEA